MTMKKKLLGLALVGSMVLPSTGAAFADSITLPTDSNSEKAHPVDVNIAVADDSNQVQGQVIVEMPTEIGFVVDSKGEVGTQNLTVKNSSTDKTIRVSVDKFVGGGNGVNIVEQIEEASKRSDVNLMLKGDTDTELNLGKVFKNTAKPAEKENILTVAPKSQEVIVVNGQAGKNPLDNGSTAGAKDQFQLVFKLTAQ